MTRATDVLKGEHRVIEQVLDCLESIAERARAQGSLDRESAADALRFVRDFADACHHGREEQHLFPAMIQKGVPGEVGPVGVMLTEHEAGRAAARRMEELISGEGDVEAFAHEATTFVGLLREHILKEDNILFPMANSVLSEEEQVALMDEFQRVESKEHGAREQLLALADRLARLFGVPLAAERPNDRPFEGCCHQH